MLLTCTREKYTCLFSFVFFFLCLFSIASAEWEGDEISNFENLLYECTDGKYKDVPKVHQIYFRDDLHEYFYFNGKRIAYGEINQVLTLPE
jgi:hypothetical protein